MSSDLPSARLPVFTAGCLREWRNGRSNLLAVCYADSVPRVATYLSLARAIIRAGHGCLLLLKSHLEAALGAGDLRGYEEVPAGVAAEDDLDRFEGVDVFFSSEAVRQAPPRSRVVRLIHSLPDKDLFTNYAVRLRNNPHIAPRADYLAIPSRQKPRAWRVENYSNLPECEACTPGRRDAFDIVPAGYPKLEYLAEAIPIDAPRRALVYCPTSPGVRQSRVFSHGEAILRALLEAFPGRDVIFRPYPEVAMPEMAQLGAVFASNPRFHFDDSVTGLAYLRETAAVVTDQSSSAVSFALATGRPAVFFNDEEFAHLQEHPIGYRAGTVDQIVEGVGLALGKWEDWRARILADRALYLYRPGEASAYLAGKLEVFAAGGSDAGWLSIPRPLLHERP